MRWLLAALAAAAAAALVPAVAHALGATPTCTPGGCTGWHTGSVRVAWTLSPDTNYSSGCDVTTISTEGTTRRVCSVSSDGTTYVSAAVQIQIDGTPPVVTGAATARPAEGSGWFRAPVDVTFAGSDGTSGVESCTSVTYAGPDSAAATVSGTCRDRAGNVSAPGAFQLRYDATAPMVAAPVASGRDGAVGLRWTAPADAVEVTLVRAPAAGGTERVVHRGAGTRKTDRSVRNGTRYRYTLLATDAAGNVGSASATVRPGRRLLAPARGAKLGGPPVLRWTKVRRARYYNVQVHRGGRKVLSRWPTRARYRLRERWTHRGRRYRLRPGRYRWYVWPGKGRRSERLYGRLVGRGSFTVAR